MARAQEVIAMAVRNFERAVPALAKLKLVIRLELKGRGDVQVFRVRVPGPEIIKVDPDDARIQIAIPRAEFNELAEKGKLEDWEAAYNHGDIKVEGDPDIQKLVATVIARQQARAKLKKG